MPGIQVLDSGAGGWTGGSGGSGGGGTGSSGDGGPETFTPTGVIPEIGTLQILLSEGEIEGLEDGLKSVYLDGTPIMASDGSFSFNGWAMEMAMGTNEQPVLDGVTGTESENPVNVRVKYGVPVTRSITSNPTAVRVRIAIPALKLINSTTGVESAYSVTIKIERQNANYTPSGGAQGDWEEVTLAGGGVIAGVDPYSTKLTTTYRIETPVAGAWQIRVTRVSADDADLYHQSATWWEAFTEIVDGEFRYPNSAVLSIQISAEQFQSIPQVNVVAKGIKVLVPSNYEPPQWTPASGGTPGFWTEAVYHTTGFGTTGGAWDGTFGDRATSTLGKKVWTSNPAWIFLDMATSERYGTGSFLDVANLDKWALYSISQWCDELVDDTKGGEEPRFQCNLYIQNQQNAIRALAQLASVFLGVCYYASGVITPLPDVDDAPSALFTNANVEGGVFTYEGTARSARHSACVVTFSDPELGWAPNTAVYEDEAAIAKYGLQTLDYQAIGCTSYGQALRLAKWAILTETMCGEVVSFVSGLEGSTVAPGVIIQVADQFRAGNTRAGGRILAVDNTGTNAVVTLDAPVTIGAGAYTLRCQTSSGMESKTVLTGAGTTDVLTVSGLFSSAPEANTGWLLQAGTTASLWRVLGVKKDEGIKYSVTALKHDPTKYTLIA